MRGVPGVFEKMGGVRVEGSNLKSTIPLGKLREGRSDTLLQAGDGRTATSAKPAVSIYRGGDCSKD